jgi:hypothetical protein
LRVVGNGRHNLLLELHVVYLFVSQYVCVFVVLNLRRSLCVFRCPFNQFFFGHPCFVTDTANVTSWFEKTYR